MKYILKLVNENEWLQYATKLIRERGNKSDEELLKEILTFNFKFDTISNECQVSSIDSQNP